MSPEMDRAQAVRRAFHDLVAERGFHGASMAAVASQAGVATGTAYVHYESKDELVYATYLELKQGLSNEVMNGFDPTTDRPDKWHHILTTAYRYFAEVPARARFMTQLEESPYYEEAHARLIQEGDPLMETWADEQLRTQLVDLPKEVLYALTMGVVIRLVAGGVKLKDEELDLLVESTWRAVARPEGV